jgi:hypothetical protein
MPDTCFQNELVAGARLVVSRRGYRHHGIYAGQGRVIHYAGRFRYPKGCIEETSLEDFIGKRPIHVGSAPDSPRAENTLRRARSRLGKCRYDPLSNNCEHFCNWCQLGEARSPQVESLTKPVRLLVRVADTLTSLVPVSKWSRAASGLKLFNSASLGQKWRKFLSVVSLTQDDD